MDKDYNHILRFLRSHEYLLDHFFMNWLVCLFMSLDLSFKRKFEILQYIIRFKKRGLFRLTIFVLSQNEEILLGCSCFAEIETKVREFYRSLEDSLLFARLSLLHLDEEVIRAKITEFEHEFDPDQYVLVDEGLGSPKDWLIQDYVFIERKTEPQIRRTSRLDDQPLKARAQIEMSTETFHKRYKNYLFPI